MTDLLRGLFREQAAWLAHLNQGPEQRQEALLWLTAAIVDINRQLSASKADLATNLTRAQKQEILEWRAAALHFQSIAGQRKRELTTWVKHDNAARADASASTQLVRLRSSIYRLATANPGNPVSSELLLLLDTAEEQA